MNKTIIRYAITPTHSLPKLLHEDNITAWEKYTDADVHQTRIRLRDYIDDGLVNSNRTIMKILIKDDRVISVERTSKL